MSEPAIKSSASLAAMFRKVFHKNSSVNSNKPAKPLTRESAASEEIPGNRNSENPVPLPDSSLSNSKEIPPLASPNSLSINEPVMNLESRPPSIIGSYGRTDNASIMTLASSTKGRRRSLDTNASIQGIVSESIFSKADSVDSQSPKL